MRRLFAIICAVPLAIALAASPAVAEPPNPHTGNVDNWGQCAQILLSIGVSPSEIAPGQSDGVVGPATIIYEKDGVTVRKVNGTGGFQFGFACHFEPPLPDGE